MKVLFVASECAPFFKVGGLGDVAAALPKELARQGVEIAVALPFYTKMPQHYKDQLEDIYYFYVKVGWRNQYCGIKKLVIDKVTYYFIDNMYYFNRDELYGYYDDGERYAFFNLAVIEMLEKIDFIPEVIHVNDWHTAMIPVLLKDKYNWIQAYQNIKTVLTIHNLKFQGIYSTEVLSDLFGIGMNTFREDGLKYYEDINLMKGGIQFADRITTVSPTYSREIQTPNQGEYLHGVLQNNSWKLRGLLNGIDFDLYNPATDTHIPYQYTASNLAGKVNDKALLQEKLNLPVRREVPIIGIVSRLTNQKGFDLLLSQMEELLSRDVQLVILGTGEQSIENSLRYFQWKYPERISVNIYFDCDFAQEIYAGSDMYLMPSSFEPCGLSQLIALRYGSVPIVRETGGLRDTVIPYNYTTSEGTGFSFYEYSGHVLMDTIDRAISLFYNYPDEWYKLIKQGMSKDFSWKHSAQEYKKIYQELI